MRSNSIKLVMCWRLGALARIMEVRPRVHAFGHIHNDGGVWQDEATLFANVTSDECGRSPTVIDITPEAVRVVAAPPERP